MSHQVFDNADQVIDALATDERFVGATNVDRVDVDQISRVQTRLGFMAKQLSTLYLVVWDTKARAVTLKLKGDTMNEVKSSLQKAMRGRVTLPNQHDAHVLLGEQMRGCVRQMLVEYMADLDEREDEDGDGDGDGGNDGRDRSGRYDSDPTSGFARRHPYILMQQVTMVVGRQLVETLLRLLSAGDVMDYACAWPQDLEELRERDRKAFASRTAAFRRVVPLLYARLRSYGVARLARLATVETRCALRHLYRNRPQYGDGDDAKKGSKNAGAGVEVEDGDEEVELGWPSVDDMMACVLGVYYEGEGSKPRVRVDYFGLKAAMERAGGNGSVERTENTDAADDRLFEAYKSSTLFADAFDNDRPEYTHGISGARRVAQHVKTIVADAIECIEADCKAGCDQKFPECK